MRCKEVIRRISETAGELDREIVEHIKTCPACARAAEAARRLGDALEAARTRDDEPATPLSEMRTRIESGAADEKRRESAMSKVAHQVTRRPKLVMGLGLAIAAFLFVTLVPFTYTKTVGYELVYSDVPAQKDVSPERLGDIMSALGYDNANVTILDDQMVVSKLADKRVAREVELAIAEVMGITGRPHVIAISQKVSGSLYAQIMEKYRIEVETEGKTDQEIAEEIKQKLEAKGFLNAEVQVITAGDERHIGIHMSEESEGQQSESELELQMDSSGDISFDVPDIKNKIEVDTEGKTDEEIKAEVEAKLAEQGQKGSEVEVITTPDGQREIRIKVNKEETIGE